MTIALSWLGGTIAGAVVGGVLGWKADEGSDMPGFQMIISVPLGALVGGAIGVIGGAIFS
jgi:hypothetical protein